jgi:predicted O-methyltransferase YrrM
MKNNISNIEWIIPDKNEKQILHCIINDEFFQFTEMTQQESEFLTALIQRNKPKKLLEVGVSSGASSVVILNAIKDFAESMLYSIDLNQSCYFNNELKIGHLVDKYKNLKTKWELYINGFSCRFLEEIGNGIDFCLIDTTHTNPGEILDFLMVLPFLREDAILVLHDVKLNTQTSLARQYAITNSLLMSAIKGKKVLHGNFQVSDGNKYNQKIGNTYFPNIAAVKLDSDSLKNVFDIFNLLTIKWEYLPDKNDYNEMVAYFAQFYDEYYIDYLNKVFEYHNLCFIMAQERKDNAPQHKQGLKIQLRRIIKRIIEKGRK